MGDTFGRNAMRTSERCCTHTHTERYVRMSAYTHICVPLHLPNPILGKLKGDWGDAGSSEVSRVSTPDFLSQPQYFEMIQKNNTEATGGLYRMSTVVF